MDAPNWLAILVGIFGVAAAVMLMTIFFDAYGALKRRLSANKERLFTVKGFFDHEDVLNVHMKDHTLVPRLRLLGFRDPNDTVKDAPTHLMRMVAFETEDGRRVLLDPNAIRMIEAVPPKATPAQMLADDLERHLAGKLKLATLACRIQAGGYGDPVQYANLSHYFADADIRGRDADYRAMQQHALRRFIALLREEADAQRLRSISFLDQEQGAA